MSDCWYMSEKVTDQRAENRLSPNLSCSYEKLASIGVYYRRYAPDEVSGEESFVMPLLNHIQYQHYDVIQISPEKMGEKFDDMARQHFEEHLHEDDEVRLILDGCGYFDVRDDEDRWVRIETKRGDCITVPAGIYHRFSTGPGKYTQALRLFKENPKWIAIPRSAEAEALPARIAYLKSIQQPPTTVVGATATATGDETGVYSICYPSEVDAKLNTIVAEHLKANHETAFIIFVTGAKDPYTHQSWCPDCVAVKSAVAEGFGAVKTKCGDAVFVELPVERAAYKGNPAYPYRTHPVLKVQEGIPTLLVLAPSNTNKGTQWYDMLDVKVYTTEPSSAVMTNW